MRHLGLAAGIFLVPLAAFAQAPVSSPAPPRDRTTLETPTGTAQLRGRVVAADTGEPLRRAQVRMTLIGARTMRLSNTDAGGRYEFTNLPAGRYTLNVNKAGYLALQFGQRRPFEGGRPLELIDGQVAEQVDFALPKGSVIVGRITDEGGDPVVGASVHAMRQVFMQDGRRRLVDMASPDQNWLSNLTNDLGEFRLFGLIPGTYFVAANAQNADIIPIVRPTPQTGGVASFDRPTGYVQTYFPGTTNVAEAEPIVVNLSEETHASFSLARGRMAEVSGTLRRSDGEPAAGARIILRPDETTSTRVMSSWGNAMTAADGSFRFGHVPPGPFILEVAPLAATSATTTLEFARMALPVDGQSVSGITLTTRPGTSVSGHVIFPAGSVPKNATGGSLRINAPPANPFGMSFGGSATTTTDEKGRFLLKNVVGSVLFRVVDLPPNLVLKSVTFNGRDITDAPYDSTNGDLTSVVITIVEHAQMTGTARNVRGQQMTDYRVAVFSAAPKPGTQNTRFVKTASADSDGRFQIGGLVAGEYVGVAVESFENGREWDPAFQQSVSGSAKRFTVKDGQALTIELPYVD